LFRSVTQLAVGKAGDEAVRSEMVGVIAKEQLIGQLRCLRKALRCSVIASDNGIFWNEVAALWHTKSSLTRYIRRNLYFVRNSLWYDASC
jgi:hypothetical protein